MKPLSDQLREDYPAVDVTTVVFSRDFAGVSCCVIPQDKVLDVISEIDRLRASNEAMRKALNDIQQRANEIGGADTMALIDTIHAMHRIAGAALLAQER